MDLEKFLRDNEDWRPYADLVALPPLPEELMRDFTDVSSEVLSRSQEYVREGGGFVTRGAIYMRVRRECQKESRRKKDAGDHWATMLCLNAPPGINTTDSFWKGRKPWYEVYGDPNNKQNNTYLHQIKRELAKRGVNLKANDEYMPELARFPGDPEAVVPFSGARSYIKNLCEQRGWACEGAVNVEHRQPDQDPHENGVPMAEDLIRQKGRKMVQSDPSLKKLPRQELREAVLAKHGPSKGPSRMEL